MTEYNRKNAYLELGSTSIKFYTVAAAGKVGRDQKVPWNLGYDVFEYGRISPGSIAHCVRTLKRFQEENPDVPFSSVTAVGTSALREAQNVEVFQRVLWEELGLRIQIIAGGIEAFLLENGFRDQVESYPTGLFDLGGGSLELIEYLSPDSTKKTSVPVGAIRLHSQLRRTRDLTEYIREGRQIVGDALRRGLVGDPAVYHELVGTGGTVRAIAHCVGSDEFGIEDLETLIHREVRGPVWESLEAHRRRLLLPVCSVSRGSSRCSEPSASSTARPRSRAGSFRSRACCPRRDPRRAVPSSPPATTSPPRRDENWPR